MMRRILLRLAVAVAVAACIPSVVSAQTAAPADVGASHHTLTGNVTLISDYRFRGISQTYKGPALQGGFDYSHSSAGSWKWISLKYSWAISDYFGLGPTQVNGGYWANQNNGSLLPDRGGSSGTYYLDLTANLPVSDKLTIGAHVGTLEVRNYGELDYTDWKVGLTYNLKGWLLGAAYLDTDASDDWYYTSGWKGNKDTGTATILVSVDKTL